VHASASLHAASLVQQPSGATLLQVRSGVHVSTVQASSSAQSPSS
jgi:hypothetical protein